MTMNDVDGILFDLEGVLWTADTPLPGAVGTLQALQAANVPFQILSNMTLKPRIAVLNRFREFGVDLDVERMMTPPAGAARWLKQNGNPPVSAFVAPQTRVELDGLNLLPDDVESGAAYVVLADLGDDWSAGNVNRALRLLLDGAELITCGMGRYWMARDGLRVDVGAYAQALAYASGKTPIVIGKPSMEYFHIAADFLGVKRERVLMVGDDILNDIQGGQRAGLKTFLVQTGKFRAQDLERGLTPDWVKPDVRHVLPLVGLPML